MSEAYQVVSFVENQNIKIEVLEYQNLGGNDNFTVAEKLYFAQKSSIKLRQVRITLKNSSLTAEAGALQFMKGNITLKSLGGSGAKGFLKGLTSSVLTNESAIKPQYQGSGIIYLEPSFKHYMIVELDHDEMIADKGLFYCCESSVTVSVQAMKNISSAIAGGEGLFQTKVSGSGYCVFEIPVPEEELVEFELQNETVQVDGNFTLFRLGNIDFTVEKSTKSIFGSAASGEGLLQTFRGTGKVIIAPTLPVYEKLGYLLNPIPSTK
ncbi:AIM24 family protein [Neobacillus dielmonensis]|uniref:AIM24 family protein n=1 Tax=Neobacillus dielmonensis TaxID=1347369 RepID=UPI0005AA2A62|nr:AIM24 family protein [Neobacillus dielmonensis]